MGNDELGVIDESNIPYVNETADWVKDEIEKLKQSKGDGDIVNFASVESLFIDAHDKFTNRVQVLASLDKVYVEKVEPEENKKIEVDKNLSEKRGEFYRSQMDYKNSVSHMKDAFSALNDGHELGFHGDPRIVSEKKQKPRDGEGENKLKLVKTKGEILAWVCLIFSFPLAGLDFFFIMKIVEVIFQKDYTVTNINGVTHNYEILFVSLGIVALALILAFLAGRDKAKHGMNRLKFWFFVVMWIGIGGFLCYMRLDNPDWGASDSEMNLTMLAVIFALVYIIDGVLMFFAVEELCDKKLLAYKKYRKKVKKLTETCNKQLAAIEALDVQQHQYDRRIKLIKEQYARIKELYFTEKVPALMKDVSRRLFAANLITREGEKKALFESVGVSLQPNNKNGEVDG
jgi:hypothetical protein